MREKLAASPRFTTKYLQRTARAVLGDITIILVTITAAALLHAVNDSVDASAAAWLIVTITLFHILALFGFGVYRHIWTRSSGHEVTILINAVFTASVMITLFMVIFNQTALPVFLVLLSSAIMLVGFVVLRYRSRLLSGLKWRWLAITRKEFPKLTRVLIVGAGDSGQAFAWRIKHRSKAMSYLILGFIDDDPEKQGMFVEGCRVLGTRHDIERIAETYKIDLIVVAVHNISGADFRDVLTRCERTESLIKVVPDVLELVNEHKSAPLLRDVQAEDLLGRSPITRHEAVDLTPVMNKVILITGAAGSIGSELSRQIMKYSPTKAVLLDNNESGLHDLVTELHAKHPEIELVAVLADITIHSTLHTMFDRHHPQIVFHAAAYKHVPMLEYYPQEAVRVNIFGTRNLIELAHEFQVERFVLISTDKAVNPSSIMGASKRVCELMLHARAHNSTNTLYTAVRFGNVLNSRGSAVPTFNRQIDSGGPVTVTHPDMTRYFMSIPEAVNLIIHAASITQGDDIYILKMGEVVRIVELAERMIRLRGLRPYQDIEIAFTGIRPGEKMHEELYHAAELPEPTIHPNIVQLNTWSAEFDPERYWRDLDTISTHLADAPKNPLQALIDLTQPQSEHGHQPENASRERSVSNGSPLG